MKPALNLAVACSLALTLGACASAPTMAPIQPVQQVNLSRYAGRWYVIGVIPTRFERNGYNATETYTLDKSGNMCTWYHVRQGSFSAPVKTLHSVGHPVPGTGNAVWSVHLYWLLRMQYKVAWLAPDYSRVIVARDKRDYAWLMARTPHISDADYQAMVARVQAMGYDVSKIQKVPQQWPPPANAPKLTQGNPCTDGVD